MYTQDYDERYPPRIVGTWGTHPYITQTDPSMPGHLFYTSDGGSGGGGYWVTWMDVIYPYIKSTQVFVCPSVNSGIVNGGPAYPSYGYSIYMSYNAPGPPTHVSGITLSAVTNPAQSMMCMDYNSPYALYAQWQQIKPWLLAADPRVVRHLDGTNVLFCDGHVKWYNRTDSMMQSPTPTTSYFYNPQGTTSP